MSADECTVHPKVDAKESLLADHGGDCNETKCETCGCCQHCRITGEFCGCTDGYCGCVEFRADHEAGKPLSVFEQVRNQRDEARRIAVALEQQLAGVEALADEWERDDAEYESVWGHHYPVSLYQLAGMLRDKLNAGADE